MFDIYWYIKSLKSCSKCDELRYNLANLPEKLRETGLEEIVVGEADCCKEYDLCASSDRKSKCFMQDMIKGEFSEYNNYFFT